MGDSFYTQSVNSFGRGFFATALPRHDKSFQADPLALRWQTWEDVFERAKRGNFVQTPSLLDLFGTMDFTLDGALIQLLGMAGSIQALDRAAALIAGEGRHAHICICQALMLSGCLRYVPAVVDSYTRLCRDGWLELEFIPVSMHYALGDPNDTFHEELPSEEFAAGVLQRHGELVRKYGSEDVCVFDGEKVSPIRFANELRRLAGEGDDNLLIPLREQFEGYTGVDCSRFYNANRFPQWLDIAAIAEDFLARRDVQQFVEGRRYFFGHPVP
jgi:hypothetical protein